MTERIRNETMEDDIVDADEIAAMLEDAKKKHL